MLDPPTGYGNASCGPRRSMIRSIACKAGFSLILFFAFASPTSGSTPRNMPRTQAAFMFPSGSNGFHLPSIRLPGAHPSLCLRAPLASQLPSARQNRRARLLPLTDIRASARNQIDDDVQQTWDVGMQAGNSNASPCFTRTKFDPQAIHVSACCTLQICARQLNANG
jgi:hypothetical protein